MIRSEVNPKLDKNENFPGKLIGSWTTQYGELDQVGKSFMTNMNTAL